jgi:RNA recognition motif-containing protein
MDNKKLFVGNLPWTVTSDSLREMFAEFGEIVEAMLITDRETGRSKGFGFVTFTTEEAAQAAISAKNNSDLEGRPMVVNVAKPKEPRNDFRGGGGGGYRGGGGAGGGYRGGGGGGGGSRY